MDVDEDLDLLASGNEHPVLAGVNPCYRNLTCLDGARMVLPPSSAEERGRIYDGDAYNSERGVFLHIVSRTGARYVQNSVASNDVAGAIVDALGTAPYPQLGGTTSSPTRGQRVVAPRPPTQRVDPVVGYVVADGVQPDGTTYIRFRRIIDPRRPMQLTQADAPALREYVLRSSQNSITWTMLPSLATQGWPMDGEPSIEPAWTEPEILGDYKERVVFAPEYFVSAFFGVPAARFVNAVSDWNDEVRKMEQRGGDGSIQKSKRDFEPRLR